ncbi:MAG: SDR family NAD(P)-dependent oxidoreductase [Spirochaetales bacterium]|nr:SDR family NAD(P)-dependent oxidoreductase [Spirochaetales bacterium]
MANHATATLVTGANSGMGRETALGLARAGREVIATVRDEAKAAAFRDHFPVPSRLVGVEILELGDLASVRAAAARLIATGRIFDTLILNAGVMTPPYRRTVDGYESQFQANYLGHALLFRLLDEAGLVARDAKVISVSSLSGEKGRASTIAEFEAVATVGERDYDAMRSYRESKLAQTLWSRELHERYGERLRSYAVHPGVVNTNLFYRSGGPIYKALMQPAAWLGYLTGFLSTPRRGASTVLRLALGDERRSGLYWAAKKPRTPNPLVEDAALRAALRDWTIRATS